MRLPGLKDWALSALAANWLSYNIWGAGLLAWICIRSGWIICSQDFLQIRFKI